MAWHSESMNLMNFKWNIMIANTEIKSRSILTLSEARLLLCITKWFYMLTKMSFIWVCLLKYDKYYCHYEPLEFVRLWDWCFSAVLRFFSYKEIKDEICFWKSLVSSFSPDDLACILHYPFHRGVFMFLVEYKVLQQLRLGHCSEGNFFPHSTTSLEGVWKGLQVTLSSSDLTVKRNEHKTPKVPADTLATQLFSQQLLLWLDVSLNANHFTMY